MVNTFQTKDSYDFPGKKHHKHMLGLGCQFRVSEGSAHILIYFILPCDPV